MSTTGNFISVRIPTLHEGQTNIYQYSFTKKVSYKKLHMTENTYNSHEPHTFHLKVDMLNMIKGQIICGMVQCH
jgi:hypothetical protein